MTPPDGSGRPGDVMLELDGVRVSYGSILALDDVSIRVHAGEVVALVGANGAGKSTALRAISGIVPCSRGEIRLAGERRPLNRMSPHEIVQAGVVHVPEGREIFPSLTVDETLDIGAYTRKNRQEITSDKQRLLEMFPSLGRRQTEEARNLSGGEQQMLAIARALMARPRLLVLDEPSLGIAPILKHEIFESLTRINEEGVTILLVEQDVALALGLGSYGYVLRTGELRSEGPAATLLADVDIQRAYLGV
jgi:branched-chain amino acid transport system ATP-binding protein